MWMLAGIIEKIDGGKVTIKSRDATTVVMPNQRAADMECIAFISCPHSIIAV